MGRTGAAEGTATPAGARGTTRGAPAATTDTEPRVVTRYGRKARWYHAGVYILTFVLLATGWWLLAGREGEPSPLARMTGIADVVIHKDAGWALVALGALALPFGVRGVATFVTDTLSYRRGDGRWLARWPVATLTGRFERHEGHFDPGQRIANIVLAGGLLVLVGTGIGLVDVHGGTAFVWLLRVHRYTTYVLTVFVAGHVVIASGLLPGYRGVWRSMHGRGLVRADVARRLWPGWLERTADVTLRSRRTD